MEKELLRRIEKYLRVKEALITSGSSPFSNQYRFILAEPSRILGLFSLPKETQYLSILTQATTTMAINNKTIQLTVVKLDLKFESNYLGNFCNVMSINEQAIGIYRELAKYRELYWDGKS